MNNIKKSPIISISVHDVTNKKHNLVEVEGRPFYALTYRKTGTTKIYINGKSLVSEKNCVTFTPKNCNYTTEVIDDTKIIAIHFDCLDDTSFQTPFVLENQNQRISYLFDMIYKKYSSEKINYECFAFFYELLEEIEKQFESKENKTINPIILKAKSEIENNFHDNNFNINKLAESLSVNSSYLRREFKKTFATSPISYLKKIRLKNAVSMLLSDYYSVEYIAHKCGYGSTSYFIQVFHKAKGYSPQKYKEKYYNKKNERKF